MKSNIFLKNLTLVMSSAASAQALGFMFIPLISRMFSPESIGVQNLFLSLAAILTPLGALTLPLAIVLVKGKDRVSIVTNASINISIVISAAVLVLIFLLKMLNLDFAFITNLGSWLYLLPFYLLFLTLIDISKKVLIKNNKYVTLSKVNLINAIVVNSSKVISGFISPTAFSLFVSVHIGVISSAIYSIKLSGVKYKKIGIKKTRDVMKEFYDFPLFRCPQMLINALSQDMPVILLASMFNVTVVGYYGMARLFMTAPINLLGNSLNSLLYPKFAENADSSVELFRLLLRSTVALAVFSFLPFSIVFFWGGELFSILLGDSWKEAGVIAEWLSIMSYFSLLARPTISLIPVINFQKQFLKYELFSFIVRVSSIFIAYSIFESYLGVVATFSIISSFIYILLIGIIFHIVSTNKIKNR
ncbi:oligosaccharide flippase family protein [Thaumasiovibrio sp. DFM-14]|uniref:oligosaccharide flippase family protein n=1 Tax=Thaumasiovibrio sp. DFM-14 TaxID=3384792 RepID=UPI0039A048FA